MCLNELHIDSSKLLGCFKLLILKPDPCLLAFKSAEGDKSSKVAVYAGDLYPSSVQLSEGLLTYREGSIPLPVVAFAILLTGKKGNPKHPKKAHHLLCILLAPFAPALQNQALDRVVAHTQADDGTQALQPQAWDNTQHHGYGSLLVTS